MKTTLSTVENLRQLLVIINDCPQIEQLEQLPDAMAVQEHLHWHIPNYRVAFDLFDERYPNERDADKWKKLRQGYCIAYSDFENKFEQRIDELTTDRASRLAYLKRSFDSLYGGPLRYQRQDEVASYLRSDKFKALKTQIDADLWNELDEMGYALWQSAVYGKSIDCMLERAFQIESEPIKDGWLWKEPNESATKTESDPDTSTVTPNNERIQPGLTERERVLIHCYRQQPAIVRGQQGYQDYMNYARPGDRTSYPDESTRKANSLIRSIEKILPQLTDTERKQAENEIDTIKANFRNQL